MNNKLKVTNEQILATILFILSLCISLSLSINQKLNLENKDYFYSDKGARILAISNRVFVILIVLFYLYIDNENYVFNNKGKYQKYQCYLEVIYLIAALAALYITVKSTNITTETENPNI